MNLLFVTLDEFRADCLSAAGHPVVSTPNLDRLAADGVRFASHFSQAAPCAPGRASLYTGMYQMNHRVVANGAPLEDRFDNIARLARRAGYAPALFGYTDQGVDPSTVAGPSDPRLDTYEGVLPGFDAVLPLDGSFTGWLAWLESLGYGTLDPVGALTSEPDRPVDHSASAYLTDGLLSWIDRQDGPWFAHASYFRPHPPYAAAGEWSTRYSPDDVGEPLPTVPGIHPLYDFALTVGYVAAPTDPGAMARLRAQYFGMVSEVDHQLGRVVAHLSASGQLDETVVVVTADHGEQLGDHGLVQKLGFFEESYRIPCIVRHPGHAGSAGRVVAEYTEGVDLLPTVAHLLGLDVPTQCDGSSLVPFLAGDTPDGWRTSAHYEWDWRDMVMGPTRTAGGRDARLERCNLAVERTDTHAYVQFADGTWLCFDLSTDPGWTTTTTDPAVVLPLAQSMLTWRSNHLGGTHTQKLLGPDRRGLWPELHPV
ncbi:MAG: sulfatase-like hydrolase/transferase [Acidimicrobiales bacterium]